MTYRYLTDEELNVLLSCNTGYGINSWFCSDYIKKEVLGLVNEIIESRKKLERVEELVKALEFYAFDNGVVHDSGEAAREALKKWRIKI